MVGGVAGASAANAAANGISDLISGGLNFQPFSTFYPHPVLAQVEREARAEREAKVGKLVSLEGREGREARARAREGRVEKC